jgi:hypothetical protein
MRKKARTSAKPISKSVKRALQLNKETVRTLSSDELTQVATGVAITCPTGSATQQTHYPGTDDPS